MPAYVDVDGKVYERGAHVSADGSVTQFGHGTDPADGVAERPRWVGHGSAAAMVLRRVDFLRAGGFDESYGLGYYEDSDLIRRWHATGRGLRLEPSVVVGHDTGSSSSDATKRALIDRNRLRFTRRWGRALEGSTDDPSWWDDIVGMPPLPPDQVAMR